MTISLGHDAQGLELPLPDDDAVAHSSRLIEAIVARIEQQDGVLRFDEYMQMALYEPGLGYYSGNSIKFGAFGDFVTAPEISSLFGFCLAQQAAALIEQGCEPSILEFGAGSGRLCSHILTVLPQLERYLILDLSAELKQRQQHYLQNRLDDETLAKVECISRLPEDYRGIVVANEMLDATPVHLLCKRESWVELGVAFDGDRFAWRELEPDFAALTAIRSIESRLGELPPDYRCVVNLNYRPWFAALADSCNEAVVLVIDYGYEQDRYYHPTRNRGTLDCYYQHRLHFDPLILPGLQDITAFIDFDACADAAEAAGFVVTGLVSQQSFLLANGLLEEAERRAQALDVHEQLAISQQVKTLTMPDEMGQSFKVLAMQKNLALDMPAMQRRGSRG